jgi:hypothetical protein
MYAGFLAEPTLIACAYDLEQELNVRRQPEMLGSPEIFPNAGLCQGLHEPHQFKGKAGLPHGKLFIQKGRRTL